jgi:hypothetical protein
MMFLNSVYKIVFLMCFIIGRFDKLISQQSFNSNNCGIIKLKTLIDSSTIDFIENISQHKKKFNVKLKVYSIDTTICEFQIGLMYSPGGDFYTFWPTYYWEKNQRNIFIKFGDKIEKEIIQRLNYRQIDMKNLPLLRKKSSDLFRANGVPTYHTFLYCIKYKNGVFSYQNFENSSQIPIELNFYDIELNDEGIEYDDYLKEKLKEN